MSIREILYAAGLSVDDLAFTGDPIRYDGINVVVR